MLDWKMDLNGGMDHGMDYGIYIFIAIPNSTVQVFAY